MEGKKEIDGFENGDSIEFGINKSFAKKFENRKKREEFEKAIRMDIDEDDGNSEII